MPIAIIQPSGPDPQLRQQLAIQQIGGAIGQFGAVMRQQQERQALIDALAGDPGAIGAIGAGTTFAGSPELGGQTNAGRPGLMPGIDRRLVEAAVLSGNAGPLLQRALPPEPVTPYQKAQLDLSREGLQLQREGRDLDREAMQLRRDQFASDQEFSRAKLALDERKLTADQTGAGQAKLSDIGSFRNQYTGLSEDFIKVRDAYGKLRAAVQDPSAAGDIALISGYMKLIDPQSVVREGEYATAANAGGIPEQIRGLWNRLVNGERLTADQRTDFARQSHNLFAAQLEQQDQLQSAYRGIAQRTMPGVDPGDAVPDFIGRSREWAPVIGQPTATENASPIGPAMGAAEQSFESLLDKWAPR